MFARTPRTGNCFALLACTHARTRARTHSRVRSVWVCQILRSVGRRRPLFRFYVFSQCFWICVWIRNVFLRNVSRISLSWPIWEAWGRDSHAFSRGIWVSVFLVPAELQFYTWLCGFFELAAVLIAFCTYFLECFQCLLMWIVVWLYFARVFSSNSASASLDYQKRQFPSVLLKKMRAQLMPILHVFSRVLWRYSWIFEA